MKRRPIAISFALIASLSTAAFAEQRVIVRAKRPLHGHEKAEIARAGGQVLYEFRHADGLVVLIPDDKVNALNALSSVEYFVRDALVPSPRPKGLVTLDETMQEIAGLVGLRSRLITAWAVS